MSCSAKRNKERRYFHQETLIQYKGGKCERCGYNTYYGALEFHHRDPSQKSFPLSINSMAAKLSKLKAEVDKCDLLCANCHREVEHEIRQAKAKDKVLDGQVQEGSENERASEVLVLVRD